MKDGPRLRLMYSSIVNKTIDLIDDVWDFGIELKKIKPKYIESKSWIGLCKDEIGISAQQANRYIALTEASTIEETKKKYVDNPEKKFNLIRELSEVKQNVTGTRIPVTKPKNEPQQTYIPKQKEVKHVEPDIRSTSGGVPENSRISVYESFREVNSSLSNLEQRIVRQCQYIRGGGTIDLNSISDFQRRMEECCGRLQRAIESCHIVGATGSVFNGDFNKGEDTVIGIERIIGESE